MGTSWEGVKREALKRIGLNSNMRSRVSSDGLGLWLVVRNSSSSK
jgi:hypothetical protein